jgi:hypothetical protein
MGPDLLAARLEGVLRVQEKSAGRFEEINLIYTGAIS